MKERNYMPRERLSFIKGHMGGNEILLLDGRQIAKGRELEVGLFALNAPNIGGHQAGLLYKSERNAPLKARIVDAASRGFIAICGGFTQVLGRALVETDLSEKLDVEVTEPVTRIALETDAGPIPVEVRSNNGRVERVDTGMKPFVVECYELGIQAIRVNSVKAMRVGKFLAVNADEINRQYPEIGVDTLDDKTLTILKKLQDAFDSHRYLKRRNADFALYDLDSLNPANSGRVIFPHRISTDSIEPACGTGTVAVGIAMVEQGEVELSDGTLEFSFESGGDVSSIGGPEVTTLKLQISAGKVVDASFSHSLVEILAMGTLTLHS